MDKYGLIGDPIGHSKSPQMQTAALKSANIAATYTLLNEPGEMLADIITRLRASNVAGFNVTTPFKQAIIPFLDELDVSAANIQAVNTVKNVAGKLIGYSTDGIGFWQSLPLLKPGTNVALIGAGGAAKSLIDAAPVGVNLRIFNRESPEFNVHYADLKELFNIELQPLASLHNQLAEIDILINATSVGLRDNVSILPLNEFEILNREALVIDLVYKHQQTQFLTFAKSTNHQTLGGLPMLVGQGAASFEIWHQQVANTKVMQASLID